MNSYEQKLLAAANDDDFVDLLHGLLQLDPSRRLTANQALRHPFFNKIHTRTYANQAVTTSNNASIGS